MLGSGKRPTYREDALVACLNEVGWAIGVLSIPAVKRLASASDNRFVLKTTTRLLQNVGGLRASQMREYWKAGQPLEPRTCWISRKANCQQRTRIWRPQVIDVLPER
jgi:hypothetical protein